MKMNEKTAVFYFSSVPYDFLYQRQHQLLREWRTNFADAWEFYYAEYPTVRRFAARKFRHAKQSLETHLLNKDSSPDDAFVLTWLGATFCFRESAVRRTIKQQCGNTQTKVAIVGSPFWEPFVSKDDFALVCYDYLDSVELYSGPYPARERHKKLLRKSDIIFVTAQTLRDDALSVAEEKDVVTVSNGTDVDFFETNKNSCKITDYARTGRKRVGYMGTYWPVDMDLVYAAARELPDVDFLLVGPLDRENQRRTHQKPENVFILGKKERVQLPAYLQLFDVALIPFKISPLTDSINPVKLYEYFSLGKPVVATATRELKQLDDGRLLRVAETQDAFVSGINTFLKYDAKEWQESRRHIARQNSWLNKATIVIQSIESRLAERPCASP